MEKAGEGPGCNFSFSLGLSASFSEFGSEFQKCVTNRKKIVKCKINCSGTLTTKSTSFVTCKSTESISILIYEKE